MSQSRATMCKATSGLVEKALALKPDVLRLESRPWHTGADRSLKAAVFLSVKWGWSPLLGFLPCVAIRIERSNLRESAL